MPFRKCLVLAAALFAGVSLAAHAQAGLYVGYSATQFSGIRCLSAIGTNNCSNGTAPGATGDLNPSGVMFGGYYDFRDFGPVRLGLDLRYNHDRSNKSSSDTGGGQDATGANTGLIGVRGVVKTPYKFMKPYGQVSFGVTNSNVTEPFCATNSGTTMLCSGVALNAPRRFDNFFRYEFFAGVDVHILPVVDLRPIELGIGNMNKLGNSGAVNGSTSVGVKSISAALVFHLPQ